MRALSRLRDGLVGAWCPSVSGWGGNVLRDLSGQGNHGTLTNMDPATDWVVSEGKQALDFDGVDDYVVVPNDPLQFPYVTLCGFATTRVTAGFYGMIGKDSGGVNRHFVLGFGSSGGTQRAYLAAWNSSGTVTDIYSSNVLSTNTKYHIAGVFNGVNIFIFVNGILEATGALSGTLRQGSIAKTNIGKWNTEQLNGQLDDIRIYNRALSPNEILLLASERGIGLKPERTRRLVQGQTFTAARLRRQSLIGSGVY